MSVVTYCRLLNLFHGIFVHCTNIVSYHWTIEHPPRTVALDHRTVAHRSRIIVSYHRILSAVTYCRLLDLFLRTLVHYARRFVHHPRTIVLEDRILLVFTNCLTFFTVQCLLLKDVFYCHMIPSITCNSWSNQFFDK